MKRGSRDRGNRAILKAYEDDGPGVTMRCAECGSLHLEPVEA